MPVRQAQLLFVIGSDEPPVMTNEGRPKYSGCTDLHRLFDKREPVHILRLDKHALRQRKRPELHPYRSIVNFITDPDQNPRTLDNLKKLLREYRGKVINRPEAVLRSTRDQVARLLDGIPGLIAPKVIRLRNPRPDLAAQSIERAGMRFPLIVRLAGTHTGRIVGLFDNMADLRAAITEPGEHIITEFVDYSDPDGIYRKYRCFFFGGQTILRHRLASDHWSVHAKDRMRFMIDKPDLMEEEKSLFDRPEGVFPPNVLEALSAVRERMPLDYFGMDFGLAQDGRVVLFEANATMNFFPFLADPRLAHVKSCLKPASEAFHAMLGCSERGSLALAERLAVAR
jgi:hypothetical protein